jgi:hypothetical protein
MHPYLGILFSISYKKLHGLGGSADSYLSLFNNPEITPVLPTTKVVLLTAPTRKVTK